MSYCTSCGTQLKNNAVFCASCGTKVEGAPVQSSTNPNASSMNTDEMKEKLSTSFSSAKATIEKSSYFNYFKDATLNPSKNTIAEGFNGLIHLLVLSVISVVAIYSLLNGSIKVALNQFGLGGFSGMASGLLDDLIRSVVPRALIASIVLYGAFVLVAYGTMKFGSKSKELTLSQVMNQYVSLLTPNILILAGISILSTLLATETTLQLSGFLIVFSLILCFISFNYFIYHNVTIQGIDKLYTLLITNMILILVLSVMVYSQVEPVVTMLNNLENMGNMRW